LVLKDDLGNTAAGVDAYHLQLVSVVAVLVIANAKLAQVVLVPPRQRERQQEDEAGDDPGLWR
jgi:hypothetical protein